MSNYTAEQIKVLEGLDAVRKRPAMYVQGGTGIDGYHQLLTEIIDNAIDECLAGYADTVEVTLHSNGSASVMDNGRGVPVDIMKKEGRPAVEVIYTVLHSGGKFDSNAYKVSGGLHGVGASVVNALSESLEVEVKREGKIYKIAFNRGDLSTPLQITGSYESEAGSGTKVTFLPDHSIFTEIQAFDFSRIRKRIKELSYLTGGVKIIFRDLRGEPKHEVFQERGGVAAFAQNLVKGEKCLYDKPLLLKDISEDIEVEVGLQHTSSYGQTILCYANMITNRDGGTPLTGFKTAYTRTLNNYAKSKGLIKKGEPNPTGDDFLEGIYCVISVKLGEPQFESQAKVKLLNPEAQSATHAVVYEKFNEILEENPKIGKAIIEKAVNAAKAREAARKARELVRRSNPLENDDLPGKLADCQSEDPSVSELYIVEGISAGGCFSGDTKVLLADRRALSFKELVKEQDKGKSHLGYTIDKNGAMSMGQLLNARVTKTNVKVIKIILDNGELITATPDHLFMLVNGEYKPASELTISDSLMPTPFFYKEDTQSLWLWNTDSAAWQEQNEVKIPIGGNVENYLSRKGNIKKPGDDYARHIVKIEDSEQQMDVYDVEVANTHNFALASGVFVHNSAKGGRERRFQAILPLRGKVLNVEKAGIAKILKNAEIRSMIAAIGAGIEGTGEDEHFDLESVRYHRVIIMADADVDGSHIRTLLLTFFYRYMRPLIEAGYLYIAQPPLYGVTFGREKNMTYIYSDVNLKEILDENKGRKANIQRYKGLGEMNADELWDTTMNPETRILKKVTIEDAFEVSETFEMLMGSEVPPRRAFIEQNAHLAQLDV